MKDKSDAKKCVPQANGKEQHLMTANEYVNDSIGQVNYFNYFAKSDNLLTHANDCSGAGGLKN